MTGSNPPSTNGSPRLARRALLTATAALAAVAAPVGLLAATSSGAPSSPAEAAASPSTSFRTDELQTIRALQASRPVGFMAAEEAAHAAAAAPVVVEVPTTVAPTTAAPAPAPIPAPAPARSDAGDPDDPASWDRLAQCESGGNWAIDTGNGYYGGLQFSLSSWQAVGGTGYPHEASRETQIEMGQRLYNAGGGWSNWPGCTRSFGWR
ncbi:MAG TPA: transglycosylase family protein [Acidimicrobiales bacterium]|nr:transglycosylase family protein [Acidimicrobiales bacterium]